MPSISITDRGHICQCARRLCQIRYVPLDDRSLWLGATNHVRQWFGAADETLRNGTTLPIWAKQALLLAAS